MTFFKTKENQGHVSSYSGWTIGSCNYTTIWIAIVVRTGQNYVRFEEKR